MADQGYCGERLMAQLDGARLVRYDTSGLLLAWFGGHGVHVFDAGGTEVDYWSCGDFAKNDASVEDVEQSMAGHLLDLDDVLERADVEGYEHGVAAGSWLVDGNTTPETARRLLAGVEDGDPMVMDALPSCPLSGEWADDLRPRDVLAMFELDEEHEAASDVLDAFEVGYQRGVQNEAVRATRGLLGLHCAA